MMDGSVHVMALITIHLAELEKDPAPLNMEVPKYEFVNAYKIKIG
jgi:hypothetical protein